MKKYLLLSPLALTGLLWSLPAKAVCPVCTIAVVAGVGLAAEFGVDDTISGVWVGGLTLSLALWTIDWLIKKKINFRLRTFLTIAAYYLLVVVPLFFTGLMTHPANIIWGMNKLVLGIVVGSAGFYGATIWYEYLKKKNDGHAYFPYQKVAMPVGALIILSFVFYLLTR
jgi:hypothetical protein